MPKQTLASEQTTTEPRSVVPPAAPRGLNREIGSVNLGQSTGSSARTAFMEDVPLQGGTPGDRVGHDVRVRNRIRIRIPEEEEKADGAAMPAAAPAGLRAVEPPPMVGGVRPPARLFRQGAACASRHTQVCLWGEEGSLSLFWERLVYLCRASTIVNHVAKVERVQQLTKA